jgi:PPOX class probable F420-dependent enzyme
MSEPIPEAAHHLFDGPYFAHVATIMRDGTPQTTPVWIAREGDTILFNTDKRRAKYRNLERDPRVSLSIHNTDKTVQPYEWIQVRGRVQGFEDDPELAQLDELSRKYTGGDYRNREPGQQRVVVRVTPERITYAPGR